MYGHIAFLDRKWSLIQKHPPRNKSTCYRNLVNEKSIENKTIFNIMTIDGHNHLEKINLDLQASLHSSIFYKD